MVLCVKFNETDGGPSQEFKMIFVTQLGPDQKCGALVTNLGGGPFNVHWAVKNKIM